METAAASVREAVPPSVEAIPQARRAPRSGDVARNRRRARRRGPAPQWAWVSLTAVALLAVLIGALDDGDAPRARAAEQAQALIEDGPQAEAPMRVTVRVAHSERSGPILDLPDDSIAHGTPNAGRLSGGVRLPVRGIGYYTYNPATQQPPGGADRRWGTAMLVSQVVELGEWWGRTHPDGPRLGIGDLSQHEGGPFRGPVVGHSSHQNGLDVDIRLPRTDGREAPATPDTYDRALTQQIVDHVAAQGAALILVGPSLDLHGPVTTWPNHDDHLHVRFADPDGTGN